MSAWWTVLGCALGFALLGLLTRGKAVRLACDFGEAEGAPEACRTCPHPCDATEHPDA